MAQVSMPSHSMTELYLIQGEVPETRDLVDARQWVTIYLELVTFELIARDAQDRPVSDATALFIIRKP